MHKYDKLLFSNNTTKLLSLCYMGSVEAQHVVRLFFVEGESRGKIIITLQHL